LPDVVAGAGPRIDASAIVGYPSSRPVSKQLVLGAEPHIRSGSVVYVGSSIGARFETGHNVVIREDCRIGDDVSVWSNSVIDYGCVIGDRVKIHANCYVAQFTDIGEDAFLAPGVTIANDLYPGQTASAEVMCGPSIGAGAQIGVNVTILPFVRIGAGCLIGAGSVVARDIPDGCVAFGNPARVRGVVQRLPAIAERIDSVTGSIRRYRWAKPSTNGVGERG